MKQYLRLSQKFFTLTTSVIASGLLSVSPSRAATFASSDTFLLFSDFSQSSSDTFTKTDVETIGTSGEGKVELNSDATAFIEESSPVGINSSFSLASGEDKNYMGLATSISEIRGVFDIEENTLFSFNFIANLDLTGSIDYFPGENASASGEVSFELWDISQNIILDSFSVKSGLFTTNNSDFIDYNQQGNISLDNSSLNSNFGSQEELAKISFGGTLERYFDSQTTIALIAATNNQVKVSAPEPSNGLPILFCGAVIAIAIKDKSRYKLLLGCRKRIAHDVTE
ncbi:MAG: hypothetical protein ACFB2X_06445 [Rivularia sp. (in: cyanobacteria)]